MQGNKENSAFLMVNWQLTGGRKFRDWNW